MSDELQNMFNDFDPGVDDAHVEKRWQAIKPFLPTEDRPRGFFLWMREGKRSKLFIAAALVSAVCISYFLVVHNRSNSENTVHLTSTEKQISSPETDLGAESSSISRNEVIRKEEFSEKLPTRKRNTEANINRHASNGKSAERRMQPAQTQALAEVELRKKDKDQITAGEEDQKTLEVSKPVEVNKGEKELVFAELLADKQLQLATTNLEATSAFNEIKPLRDKPGSKLSVEVFGGVDLYRNSLTEGGAQRTYLASTKNNNSEPTVKGGSTYVFGAAIHHSLGRRFFIPIQFMYAGSQKVLEQINTGSFRVSRPIVSSITGQADTQVVYQHFTETLTIKAQRNIKLGLGLGVRLFASPVFTVSGLVEGELNRATYLRTNAVTFDEEEYSTPSPGPASFANTSGGYSPNSSLEFTSSTYRAMAGLHLARRIGPQLAITGRLSYHHCLQTTDMQGISNTVSVRPLDLMIAIGMNYRLK